MRDFSLLAIAITSLVLGSLILMDQPGTRATDVRGPRFQPVFGVFEDEPPTPTPTIAATPKPPSTAPIARIEIASVKISAPVIKLGVDPDGTMQAPKTATDVGWYDFSAQPGYPGNAVFAGHVDFAPATQAIFWTLRNAKPGDEVRVGLTDGTLYTYRIVSSRSLGTGDAPIEDIIGPTQKESITLITCDGSFNTKTHEYDKRLVVRAERIA